MALGLDPGIEILQSICEQKPTLLEDVKESLETDSDALAHANERMQSEQNFFQEIVNRAPDRSNPILVSKNAISEDLSLQALIRILNPDVLVCYGTSIIREPLLTDFRGRFLNIHLGLSPYYRGSATNFWPLVYCEPELVGATFMHIDSGVDTGEVVHQIRARIFPDDTPHTIGNRLIEDVTGTAGSVIRKLSEMRSVAQSSINHNLREEKVFRRRDFSGAAVRKLRANFANGLLEEYCSNKNQRDQAVPIFDQGDFLR
ncbi:MAG: formyltransferase family protein [Ilumatobacteraceae bacterium]